MIGNSFHNYPIPDYNGIEIKTKSSTKEEYITLFNSIPDSFLFEIKRIIKEYGYPDKDYPEYNIFNLDINSHKYNRGNTSFYFKLKVDELSRNVILEVYDKRFHLIDNKTKWSFDLLKEKLELKLSNLAIVKAERKFVHNELYFKYNNINFYKLKGFDTFIDLIKKGLIKISFRIGIYKTDEKLGQIYDHGSSFCIKLKNIEKLFQKVNLEENQGRTFIVKE